MEKIARSLAALGLIALSAGCGTLGDLASEQRIYGGTRADWGAMHAYSVGIAEFAAAFGRLGGTVDLPFSIALDTALVPVTVPLTIGRTIYFSNGDPGSLQLVTPGFGGAPRSVRWQLSNPYERATLAHGESRFENGAWRSCPVPSGREDLTIYATRVEDHRVSVHAGRTLVIEMPRPGRFEVTIANPATETARAVITAMGPGPLGTHAAAEADVAPGRTVTLPLDLDPGVWSLSCDVGIGGGRIPVVQDIEIRSDELRRAEVRLDPEAVAKGMWYRRSSK